MTVKSYGPGVSGYLDPEGRSYETSVVMAGKFLLDVELNLGQDLAAIRRAPPGVPSGWWCQDFLGTDDPTQALFTSSPIVNTIQFPALTAFVNGIPVQVTSTNVSGANLVDLGAPPSSVGSKRWDLVVLEVWRRVLTAAGTTTGSAGKSAGGRIWRNGNVKVALADDATINLVDDILNPTVGQETTKRVQIQYRLRTIQGVDLDANPFGVTDSAVVANTVPASAAFPDGVASSFSYTLQSAAGDPGLYRAGDGNPANSLGTTDGYVYCIPLMAVSRRNTVAFDRNSNHNGGSGRPDSLIPETIVATDILDLRQGVSPTGWDYQELCDKNFNLLLDNKLRSEFTTTLTGGGVKGSQVLKAVEIGVSNANGGNGTTTGDTPGADFIGQFDGVRRTFSDQPVLEFCWIRLRPQDCLGAPAVWPESLDSDRIPANVVSLTLNPSALPIYRHPAINWTSYLPAGTIILDMVEAYWDKHSTASTPYVGADVSISGLGSNPMGPMTVSFYNSSSEGYDTEDLMVKLVVAYPPGQGLVSTPVGTEIPPVVNNPAALPADFVALTPNPSTGYYTDYPLYAHREIGLEYTTTNVTQQFLSNPGSVFPSEARADNSYITPLYERAESLVGVTVNGSPAGIGTDVFLDKPFNVRFVPGFVSPTQQIVITYQARRPIQQTGAQVTAYYQAAAPQTVKTGVLPDDLYLSPKWVSPWVYSMTAGTGSDGVPYPYPNQSTQTGGAYPSIGGSYSGDHLLNSNQVSAGGFTSTAGLTKLPAHIPPALPALIRPYRTAGQVDSEGRSFYASYFSSYQPSAFGPNLPRNQNHRVLIPMIAELTQDTTLGPKGQLVLVTIQRWCRQDSRNSIEYDSNLNTNTTSLSVYRLKGNLLSNRQGA